MFAKDRIIVALDFDNLEEAKRLVGDIAPYVGYFKVGLELLTAEGAPKVVAAIHELGGKVFLDGKFNDIPNTIAGAAKMAAKLGVEYFDVHASSGVEAMKSAVANKGKSKLLVVTVLTSLDEFSARSVFGMLPHEKVVQFAREAMASGADGVICSPQELTLLQLPELRGCIKVTPGIRPSWAAANDQKRVMTPAEAIQSGATHLVIGRPITSPPKEIGSPVEAAKKILDEVK